MPGSFCILWGPAWIWMSWGIPIHGGVNSGHGAVMCCQPCFTSTFMQILTDDIIQLLHSLISGLWIWFPTWWLGLVWWHYAGVDICSFLILEFSELQIRFIKLLHMHILTLFSCLGWGLLRALWPLMVMGCIWILIPIRFHKLLWFPHLWVWFLGNLLGYVLDLVSIMLTQILFAVLCLCRFLLPLFV